MAKLKCNQTPARLAIWNAAGNLELCKLNTNNINSAAPTSTTGDDADDKNSPAGNHLRRLTDPRAAYVLGLFVCKTVSYLQGVAVSASINTMVTVTMDR